MASPGGYQFQPGLYRVPDLLTEEQFIQYMKANYGVVVSFNHGDREKPSPARALGQSRSMGVVNEDEDDMHKMGPSPVHDPVLRSINEMDFKSFQDDAMKVKDSEKVNSEGGDDSGQETLDLLMADSDKDDGSEETPKSTPKRSVTKK